MAGRLTIFAKGNADIRDCLVAQRRGDGVVAWNGINEVLRVAHPGWIARVRHETFTRSDALLAAGGIVPDALAGRALPLGAYPLASQFAPLCEAGEAVAILSIQPDVMTRLARHRGDGHLFYPAGVDGWAAADRRWLADAYAPAEPLAPAQAIAGLEEIAARLRRGGTTRILVFNMSPIIPWERIHNHHGLGEGLAERIRRFNLALVELSRRSGISIVDVDAVLARAGAERLKVDAVHLTAEGCRLVAQEVVRILADLGCFAAERAAA